MKRKIVVALQQTFFETIIGIYSLLAALFGGILSGALLFYSKEGKDYTNIIIVVSVYLIVFAIMYNIKAIKNVAVLLYENNKDNPYAKAIRKLSSAFGIIHEVQRNNNYELKFFISMMESFCSIIKDVYEEVSENSCSVSIKILIDNDVNETNNIDPQVITLCRDTVCSRDSSREPRNGAIKHVLTENSCYHHFLVNLGKKKEQFYLNNNIVETFSYKNSSFKFFGEQPSTKDIATRNKEWPLPYKSELVLPIKLKEDEDNSSLIGFICIDSDKVNTFNEENDPYMGIGVADGIYNILKEFKKVNKK